MSSYRMTIRNVDPELADLLREMAGDAGMTLGDAFDEAVIALENFWNEEEPETSLPDQRQAQVAAWKISPGSKVTMPGLNR